MSKLGDGGYLNYLSDGSFAEMAIELLSLREQLAELKQQKPIGRVISCNGNKTLGWINDAPEGTLLFTAAKPAEIPRHIFSMLVNELRDVPAIGCKRELIVGVLNRHGVIAEPVQLDPPATE
ncbi:polyphosphate kinase [Yersinia enterocolitica]|uniref:polyphosphate kinase n=1 Tax=Yersinia enterocolitica TaxID=630 RepID=UPI003CFCC6D4